MCWESCWTARIFLIENAKDIMSCCSIILCVQVIILTDVQVTADSTYVLWHDVSIYLGSWSYMHWQ